jgi:NAD-dependent SIR2 family protein deacetylase
MDEKKVSCESCDKKIYPHKHIDNKPYCLKCYQEIKAIREMNKRV